MHALHFARLKLDQQQLTGPKQFTWCVQEVQRLPLDLEPGRVGACRLSTICQATNAATGTQETPHSTAAHAPMAVYSCLGQRAAHALLRLEALCFTVRDLRERRAGMELIRMRSASPHQDLPARNLARRRAEEEAAAAAAALMDYALKVAGDTMHAAFEPHMAQAMQRLCQGATRLRLVDKCHSVTVDGHAYDVEACCNDDGQLEYCLCALQAWRAAQSGLFSVADESIYRCVEQLAAAHRSAVAELRLALLVHVVGRLVDQNLRAIKARLWRPQGPLIQRREAALRGGGDSAATEAACAKKPHVV